MNRYHDQEELDRLIDAAAGRVMRRIIGWTVAIVAVRIAAYWLFR